MTASPEMAEERKLEWRERCTLQGEARLLRRLLQRRFGALPAWVNQRLEKASEQELIRWGRGILGTKLSLEQLLGT
jgi:hypothetical protein